LIGIRDSEIVTETFSDRKEAVQKEEVKIRKTEARKIAEI
jgi:hypothetical protein